jgi:putative transcriptional regulator
MQCILDRETSLAYTVALMVAKYRMKNRLKVARAERDLSQDELARLVGVTRQTIGSVESGQYCPSTKLALTIALKLGKKVEDVFYLEEEHVQEG